MRPPRPRHPPAPPCESCGLPSAGVAPIAVRDVDGRRGELLLCSRCLKSEDRAWRLRWAPQSVAA